MGAEDKQEDEKAECKENQTEGVGKPKKQKTTNKTRRTKVNQKSKN